MKLFETAKYKKTALAAAAGVSLVLMSSAAHAAKFGVRVVGADGAPVAGAAVCIGTHGNYKQFGAMFTSKDGDVMVDVPAIPLVVTVSKTRFAGVRMVEPARRFDLIKEVKLHDGVPGPRCKADSAMADAGDDSSSSTPGSVLTIENVEVNDGIYTVSLTPSVVGTASHYRLASSDSFKGAKWRSFKGQIPVDMAQVSGDSVYLQMRRYKAVGKSSIETQSNVVMVSLQGL